MEERIKLRRQEEALKQAEAKRIAAEMEGREQQTERGAKVATCERESTTCEEELARRSRRLRGRRQRLGDGMLRRGRPVERHGPRRSLKARLGQVNRSRKPPLSSRGRVRILRSAGKWRQILGGLRERYRREQAVVKGEIIDLTHDRTSRPTISQHHE